MPVPPRPATLLLAAVLVLSPALAEAKRHGHGNGHGHGHRGWMHARFAAVRGWFGRVAHEPLRDAHSASQRSAGRSRDHVAEQAALAARRRSEVDAYLRDHPVYASAE